MPTLNVCGEQTVDGPTVCCKSGYWPAPKGLAESGSYPIPSWDSYATVEDKSCG